MSSDKGNVCEPRADELPGRLVVMWISIEASYGEQNIHIVKIVPIGALNEVFEHKPTRG